MASQKSVKNSNTKIMALALIGVLLASGAVISLIFLTNDSEDQATLVCIDGPEGNIAQTAAPLLTDSSKWQELDQVADKITQIDNYQNDPNCLYIATINNLNLYELDAAQNHYTQLKDTYNEDVGFDEAIEENALTLGALGEAIDIKVKQQKQTQKQVENRQILVGPKEIKAPR